VNKPIRGSEVNPSIPQFLIHHPKIPVLNAKTHKIEKVTTAINIISSFFTRLISLTYRLLL